MSCTAGHRAPEGSTTQCEVVPDARHDVQSFCSCQQLASLAAVSTRVMLMMLATKMMKVVVDDGNCYDCSCRCCHYFCYYCHGDGEYNTASTTTRPRRGCLVSFYCVSVFCCLFQLLGPGLSSVSLVVFPFFVFNAAMGSSRTRCSSSACTRGWSPSRSSGSSSGSTVVIVVVVVVVAVVVVVVVLVVVVALVVV